MSQQLASGLYRNMSEFVRTCAIYIGIAVLVAVVMVAGMPVLRMQVTQMHRALLVALAPEAFDPMMPPSFSPPGPLVSAISLDPIPGATLPAPVGAAPDRPLVARPTPAAPPGADTDDVPQGIRADSPAVAMAKLGVTRSQQDALIKYISRKYLVAIEAASMFVDTAYVVGTELNLDPVLLLAIMATESRFNPYAGGPGGGATGLMQVVTSVHRAKFSKFGRGDAVVFNPVANVRVGAFILADCVRRRGSVVQGLLCYCGASAVGADGGYTEKVQSERRRLALAASISIKD